METNKKVKDMPVAKLFWPPNKKFGMPKPYNDLINTLFPRDEQYDMMGSIVKYGMPQAGIHGSDEFKLPGHITFSDESKGSVAGPVRPGIPQGGHWGREIPGQETFTPSAFNLTQHPIDQLEKYFKKAEPKVKLLKGNQ